KTSCSAKRNRDEGSCSSTLVSSTNSLRCAVGRRLGRARVAEGRGVGAGAVAGAELAGGGTGLSAAGALAVRAGAAGAAAGTGAGAATGAVLGTGVAGLDRMAATGRDFVLRPREAERDVSSAGPGTAAGDAWRGVARAVVSTRSPGRAGGFGRGMKAPGKAALRRPGFARLAELRPRAPERARRAIPEPGHPAGRPGTCCVRCRAPACRTCSSAS